MSIRNSAEKLLVAHTPDEKLAKQELAEAIELYVKVAQTLAGQG